MMFKATSRMGDRWVARGEEEARGTRTEKICCEEEENKVEWHGVDSTGLFNPELAQNKELARCKEDDGPCGCGERSGDRDWSSCKEDSWKYWPRGPRQKWWRGGLAAGDGITRVLENIVAKDWPSQEDSSTGMHFKELFLIWIEI